MAKISHKLIALSTTALSVFYPFCYKMIDNYSKYHFNVMPRFGIQIIFVVLMALCYVFLFREQVENKILYVIFAIINFASSWLIFSYVPMTLRIFPVYSLLTGFIFLFCAILNRCSHQKHLNSIHAPVLASFYPNDKQVLCYIFC